MQPVQPSSHAASEIRAYKDAARGLTVTVPTASTAPQADSEDDQPLTPEEEELLRQKLERKAERDRKRAKKTIDEFKELAKGMEPVLGKKISAKCPMMLTRLAAMLMGPTSWNHKVDRCTRQHPRYQPLCGAGIATLNECTYQPVWFGFAFR
jgi:hypothetical protein